MDDYGLEHKRLAKKAIKGDRNAYTEIIKEYKEYLYKMAFLHMKDEELSLEVLQETVYRGFMNIGKLKKPEYFKTWITRILINTSIDIQKSMKKIVPIDDECVLESKPIGISVEEKIDLYRAIDYLKDKYKTVIIMKYFDDMKISQIASLMEIPESTVKTYLSRARKELGCFLKEGYLNE